MVFCEQETRVLKEGLKIKEGAKLERNGLIPSWAEVFSNYLQEQNLKEGELNFFKAYYRGQRRLAQGQKKRGQRILNFLEKNPQFLAFEEQYSNLLNEIASFVRGPTEKRQKQP